MGKTRNTAADSLLLRRLIFRLLPVQMLLAAMGSVNSIVDGVIAARSINPASVAVIGLHFTMVRILEAVSLVLSGDRRFFAANISAREDWIRPMKCFH